MYMGTWVKRIILTLHLDAVGCLSAMLYIPGELTAWLLDCYPFSTSHLSHECWDYRCTPAFYLGFRDQMEVVRFSRLTSIFLH